jgi:hypothetical protein
VRTPRTTTTTGNTINHLETTGNTITHLETTGNTITHLETAQKRTGKTEHQRPRPDVVAERVIRRPSEHLIAERVI